MIVHTSLCLSTKIPWTFILIREFPKRARLLKESRGKRLDHRRSRAYSQGKGCTERTMVSQGESRRSRWT